MQILTIRHVPFEHLGRISEALEGGELGCTYLDLYREPSAACALDTFAGLIVTRSQYRPGSVGQVDIQEGDEVRPGLGIVSIVDTSQMLVRARINQADIGRITTGQPAKVRLDGFPELLFNGRVELVTPLAIQSEMSQAVRTFTAVIAIEGTHEQLLPDLTASVEIPPAGGR